MHLRDAGDVSSGPREACNEAAFNRIIAHDHYDWDGCGRVLDGGGQIAAKRKDYVWIEPYQFIGKVRSPLVFSGHIAVRDGDCLAINVAESLKSAKAWIDSRPIFRRKEKHSDPPRACWLLGSCDHGPRRRAAESRDERAPIRSTNWHQQSSL
jgi:hypothetical protein